MRVDKDNLMLKVPFAAKAGPSAGNSSRSAGEGLAGHMKRREGGLKTGVTGGVATSELHGPVEEHRLGWARAPGPGWAFGQVRCRPALEDFHRHVNELLS